MNRFLIIIGLALLLITNCYAVEQQIQKEPISSVTVRNLYLDLMKRCLTNWIYGDLNKNVVHGGNNIFERMIVKSLNYAGYQIVRPAPMRIRTSGAKGGSRLPLRTL